MSAPVLIVGHHDRLRSPSLLSFVMHVSDEIAKACAVTPFFGQWEAVERICFGSHRELPSIYTYTLVNVNFSIH